MANLDKKLKQVEKEILQLTVKENKHSYYLHSILVHSGDTEYGHYYSFIYDRSQKQWYCFNDHKVEKVDEKVVMQESYGSKDSKFMQCAYSLIYVN